MVEENREDEDSSAEEIPNPKNAEEVASEDRKVDSSVYYLFPAMSRLRAQLQRDYNWITWAFKQVTNIRVLAQHYPPQFNFARIKITAGDEDGSGSRSHNKVTFVDPTIRERATHIHAMKRS